ncbi:hypothetical protein [uncultured Reyranella sp.]|uniref:hypothetical protein n=1 Tax=uncultured Reyranella sp. TaxID=735512 RepID=UPI0025CC7C86|nr:hypothetical protein [uncultured Reyranella sp.]
MSKAALIGKAGEALVAAELMRRGIYVAQPAYDGGIDLLAFREAAPTVVVPIQVKARAGSCYHFQKAWFAKAAGMVVVQVWDLETDPCFYVFASLNDVADALGDHAKSPSWAGDTGAYNVTVPSAHHLERMERHRDRWDRIIDRLRVV